MKRRFRLTRSSDYQRVRRTGKTYAHPLIVLITLENDTESSRFAVVAGRSVGNAVQRNRAKRLIRETIRPLLPAITPGWDVVVLARKPISAARYQQVRDAVSALLKRAHLLVRTYEN